jgi:nuclear pore complex protein Nup98-Nup96
MVRFSALPSDSSGDDLDYTPHDPTTGQFAPPPPRLAYGFSAGKQDDEDDEDASSVSNSSYMDEDEHMESSPRRRRRDRRALLEGPDGEYYHPHELEDADDSGTASSSDSSFNGEPLPPSRDLSVIPRAQQIGVDAQKMHSMQASLFRVPEEAEALRQLNAVRPSVKRFSLAPLDPRVHARGLSAEPDAGMKDVVSEVRVSANDGGPVRLPVSEGAFIFGCACTRDSACEEVRPGGSRVFFRR